MTRDLILVVAPFRSGSTAVWSLLRRHDDITAYYEPLHERLPEFVAQPRPIDPTHLGVADDYFAEYRSPGGWAEARSIQERAAAASFTTFDDPVDREAMEAWISWLVASASTPKVVLQFNRLCLALPALREMLPGSLLVTLHRPARECWLSGRRHTDQAFSLYAAHYARNLPTASTVERLAAQSTRGAELLDRVWPARGCRWFDGYHRQFDLDAARLSDLQIQHGELSGDGAGICRQLEDGLELSAGSLDPQILV
ncbi:MAG: sulfotransferase [Actinomycetia bacterium]|nr:sulfotransferase [Actinomycetes bacterium]